MGYVAQLRKSTLCFALLMIVLVSVQAMEASKSVIFNVFTGVDFESWLEEMTLMLMALDLWGVVTGEEKPPKSSEAIELIKSYAQRKQKAFAVISLNLSTSCRDCLRQLEGNDPRQAWESIQRRFGSLQLRRRC